MNNQLLNSFVSDLAGGSGQMRSSTQPAYIKNPPKPWRSVGMEFNTPPMRLDEDPNPNPQPSYAELFPQNPNEIRGGFIRLANGTLVPTGQVNLPNMGAGSVAQMMQSQGNRAGAGPTRTAPSYQEWLARNQGGGQGQNRTSFDQRASQMLANNAPSYLPSDATGMGGSAVQGDATGMGMNAVQPNGRNNINGRILEILKAMGYAS